MVRYDPWAGTDTSRGAVGGRRAGRRPGPLTAHNWLHVAWPPVLPSSWWDWSYNALEIGAVALYGARVLARRRDRAAWLAVTIGMGFFAAADLSYMLAWGDANVVPFPSLAGIMALTGFSVRGQWPVIAIGFIVFAVADSIYLVQTANGTYVSNGLLDVGWPAAMSIIAFGAWRRPASKARIRLDGWGLFLDR